MSTLPIATPTPSDSAAPGSVGRALIIGEALVDIVAREGETPQEIPGGSPANVALGLARLGRTALLDCWIAQDARGQVIRSHLEASGVALMEGSDGAQITSTAQAHIGSDGAATYVFDLDWNPPLPALDDEAPLLVHTGSIAAILTPGADTVRRTLQTYRSTSTICYDPNARPQLMGQASDARRTAESLVALADLVKCSDEDIAWFYSVDPHDTAALESALQHWLDLGAALVVVTRGKHGALALSASGVRVEVPADPNVTVADTVGAGDSFMGGLEDGLWSEGLVGAQQREHLRQIDAETLERVVRHAAAIADITVSRVGANPPTRAELNGR